VLRARGAPGDGTRADTLLREAADAAAALGVRLGERFGFDPETLIERKA
jgi:hypothetical protein